MPTRVQYQRLFPLLFTVLLGSQFTFAQPREPLGLLPVEWPTDNPYSVAKAELGRLLFFDKRLSSDGNVSCGSCHRPELAFTDGLEFPKGVGGNRAGDRATPSLINRAYGRFQFWDGRTNTLEEQSAHPFENQREMGMSRDCVEDELRRIPGYAPLFAKAFGNPKISFDRVAQAIATFERTILSGNSRFDRYMAGDRSQLQANELRGLQLFFGKAQCSSCHSGPNFTSEEFTNLGIGVDRPPLDKGRSVVTGRQEDWGAFKVPTLREVSKTGPWMHDSRMKKLENAMNFYRQGGILNAGRDRRIVKLDFDDAERADLIEFLKTLDGEGWQQIVPPTKFPD
ncbi:MAG: c-type cytochrome [Acidobacteria bacterium]|nr:c-type cytochrome [Acidobacteriota bacterium]